METTNRLLVVIDAGHGGYDNGAAFEGRLEKDDNLRLALAVRQHLEAMGIPTLMTREDDTFIPLPDRANMANQAGARLFLSLHRNSYTEHTPSAHGVENIVYLTAPVATEEMARLVLDEVVRVGVQADRGVTRGDYYVLRRTQMPAMLLEMGFIIDPEDNRLFDEKMEEYAAAIARGVVRALGMPKTSQGEMAGKGEAVPVMLTVPDWPEVPAALPAPRAMPESTVPVEQAREIEQVMESITEETMSADDSGVDMPPAESMPEVMPPPEIMGELPTERQPDIQPDRKPPAAQQKGSAYIRAAQTQLNRRYGFHLEENGFFDAATRSAGLAALQEIAGISRGQKRMVGGDPDAVMLPTVGANSPAGWVVLLQIWLLLREYDTGGCSGQYDRQTRTAVLLLQREEYLPPSGQADAEVWAVLLGT